jgi:hypothetical protein
MLNRSLRIYVTANILVYAGFALYLFPEGIIFGFLAIIISFLLSSPVILMLLLVFYILSRLRLQPVYAWIVFLIAIGLMAYTPVYFFLMDDLVDEETQLFLAISFASAYLSVAFQCHVIHKLFKSFSRETTEEPSLD